MAPLPLLCALICIFIPASIAQYNESNVVYYSTATTIGSQFRQNLDVLIQGLEEDTPPANPRQRAYVYGQGNSVVYGYGQCNSATNNLCSDCLISANQTIKESAPLATGARLRRNYTSYSCYLRYETSAFDSLEFVTLTISPAPSPSLNAGNTPPPPNLGNGSPNSSPTSSSGKNSTIIIVAAVCGVIVVILAGLIAFYCIKRAKNRRKSNSQDWEAKIGETAVRQFTYSYLSNATKDFSELLGEGGFGKVYKGVLPNDGSMVAVKIMSQASKHGLNQFLAEVSVIGQVRHKNLVSLKGWCHEGEKLMLVYDYMQNGSLDQYLSDKFLAWNQRFEIVKDVAEGLAYLHGGWERRILHRDIKAANVLLDSTFMARLGDFGLAKLMENAKSQQTMTQAGTRGYIAPELAYLGKANEKSDVYSFGILLLEIACGRGVLQMTSDDVFLWEFVWDAHEHGDLLSVVDSRLESDYDHKQVLLVLSLGMLCSHPDAELRPSSRRCCLILNGEVPLPDVPASKPIVNLSFGHATSSSTTSQSTGYSTNSSSSKASSHLLGGR